MSIICHIDQSVHPDLDSLHEHIKPLMKRESYYRAFYPKVDKLTGEEIPFKDASQYLSTDFISKSNMRKWVLANKEAGREWAINWLKQRKEDKKLVYAPSQAELRSLCCPSMPYYDSAGDYYDITRELGFKDRFCAFYQTKDAIMSDLSDVTVICDTREQTPLSLPLKTEIHKLDYGDYALAAPHDQGIYIERKSLNDFVGSLTTRKIVRKKKGKDSSYERIERELTRAQEAGHYIVMLVESPIDDALNFDSLPWMQHGKASPAYIWHNLRELLVRFPLSFQVVFANGRADAARKAIKIFQLGERVRKIDLEYAAERGLI